MTTALVTGGAGFIGSHLVEALVRQDIHVRVLDSLPLTSANNLTCVIDQIDYICGDLRDPEMVRQSVGDVDVVFHQAAVASVQDSIDDPHTTIDVNISGTLNLLTAAADAGCQRVVIASSAAVYGDSPEKRKAEDQKPAPLTPYAVSKLVDEQFAAFFTRQHDLETVCLRYFNVYGPRQDPSSAYAGVISRFVDMARSQTPAVIYGDGNQTRDFINVADVVRANVLAANALGVSGQVFNIALGKPTSIAELWRIITATLGIDLSANYQPARPGDIRESLAGVRLARKCLSFEGTIDLRTGISELIGQSPSNP